MAIQLKLCSEEAIKTGVVGLLLSQWDEEHRVNFISRSPRCPELSRIQTKAECQRLHRAWMQAFLLLLSLLGQNLGC